MREAVKLKRRYASGQRVAQAAETRARVIATARNDFITLGWQTTTIAGIARNVGVSAETIYAVFGSKPELLRAVITRSVRRGEPDTPLLEQAGPKALAAALDQPALLQAFARDIADVLSEVAELMAVARVAAQSDPALDALFRDLHEGRRRNLASVGAALLRLGPLRDGLRPDEAAATVWRMASPELYLLLTVTEGMAVTDYADWLSATLGRLLLA